VNPKAQAGEKRFHGKKTKESPETSGRGWIMNSERTDVESARGISMAQ
jgi:hypothetical protein